MSYFVNLEEVGYCIDKAFESENYLRVLSDESEDFRRGVNFGMAQAYVVIASQCKRYEFKEQEYESEADEIYV